MTETIKENKQLSIIENAKEAIKNFPEKKNTTHKEIIELVEKWDNYDKWEKENKEHNRKLREKYNEIEPIIEEAKKAQEILKDCDYKLSKIIDELYKDKIAQAWKRTKEGDGYSAEYLKDNPTPSKNCTFYQEISKVEELKRGNLDRKSEALRQLLKDGYSSIYSETWRHTESYWEDKKDSEKKLKTRLAKLGIIEK